MKNTHLGTVHHVGTCLCAAAAMVLMLPGTTLARESRARRDRGLRPVGWTKFSANPVLPEGAIGAWDHLKSDPSVIKDGNLFRMWYGANVAGAKTGIGYAESPDGITWVQSTGFVLDVGEEGQWDDEDVETPAVVKRDGVYHLWYSGRGEPEGTNPILKPDAAIRVGHATSPDGLNWVKDPANPVLEVGRPVLGFDGLGAAEPSVIYDEGVFKMWYTGVTLQGDKLFLQIGYATSPDGTTWQKYPFNPVLTSPAFNGITTPSVIRRGRILELWYTIFDESTGLPAGPIREAVSFDGIRWLKVPADALVKGRFPEWDGWAVFGPTVLFDGSTYRMWYSGVRFDGTGVHLTIGHATRGR